MLALLLIMTLNPNFAMMDSLRTAASGMEVQRITIDSLANDFANMNTNGYKSSRVDTQDLQYKTILSPGASTSLDTRHPLGIQIGMGAKVASIQKMFEEGSLKTTNNPLDFAIAGQGFFAVLKEGQIYYTRDGAFTKDGQGRIVSHKGEPLQPEVTIPIQARSFSIGEDGIIEAVNADAASEQIGQIQIAIFSNPGGLLNVGGNLYLPTEASGNPVQGIPGTAGFGRLQHGFVESSNVNAVTGMVSMISAQRAYELNSKVIQAADQMLQSTVNMR
jgi:flagellar basal-body rod protein FlgG